MTDRRTNDLDRDVSLPEPTLSSADITPVQDHSFTLQQIHHLTGDVGGLKEAVNTLKQTVSDQSKTLNWIKYAIFVAIGAGFIIGYFFDKRFDQIMETLAKSSPRVEAPQFPKPGQ